MADRKSTDLNPEIFLQRLKRLKTLVDKGKTTDFSKLCEKTMHNVYVGPLLRKHGAVARKEKGGVYYWNGLALNLKFAGELLAQAQKRAKLRNKKFQQRKAEINKAKGSKSQPPPITEKLLSEMIGEDVINKISDQLKGIDSDKVDSKLDTIINLLQTYNDNMMHVHSACLKMLNGFEVIAGQMEGVIPVTSDRMEGQ